MDEQDDFMAPFDIASFVAATSQQDQARGHHNIFDNANNNEGTATTMTSSRIAQILHQNQADNPQQVNIDAFQSLLAMQAVDSSSPRHHQSSAPPSFQQPHPSLLEQQLRINQLQQLQQLQNHIFQQQIELISSQNAISGSSTVMAVDSVPPGVQNGVYRDTGGYQLPTPVSSTELRAVNPDLISPVVLQNFSRQSHGLYPSPNSNLGGPTSTSSRTPAHLAFSNNSAPLPSPAELDFELSPLTSPWLGAYQQPSESGTHPNPNTVRLRDRSTTTANKNKRAASSSGVEDNISTARDGGPAARKRPSPAIRPTSGLASVTNANNNNKRASHVRGSASMSSTPVGMSSKTTRGMASGMSDEPADTPSPVDLSMLPPAPPATQVSTAPQSQSTNPSPGVAPVTPASIMNLGRFGLHSGLSPTLNGSDPVVVPVETSSPDGKTNAMMQAMSMKSKPSPMTSSGGRVPKKVSNTPLISPSLKPLLPAGNINPGTSPNVMFPNQPTLQVRKTSHKAAEQKRRDSLKTTFDDLRMLLPPIPLPSDEGYDGEPLLPGAMPPRGPPRVDGGPNRAVSKLQLLRCGNDYIRSLIARSQRRDEYIEGLKKEIQHLRELVAPETLAESGLEMVDLEKDLDAIEAIGGATKLGIRSEMMDHNENGSAQQLTEEGEGDDDDGGD